MSINKKYTVNTVIENIQACEGIYKLKIEGNFKAEPGQFYMLRSWDSEPILWRPISVHNVDENGENIEFLYAVVGQGTEFLSRLKREDKISVVGPLGNGFDIEEASGKKVALVTGGIGVAPIHYLSKKIKNSQIDVFAGFKHDVYGLEEIKNHVNSVNISTEDGSYGHKGYITEIFEPEKYDLVLCCGPEIMMYKVINMCREKNTKVYISEEKKMACGLGACLVCTCKTKHGNKRTCVDGPVFSGEDIEL